MQQEVNKVFLAENDKWVKSMVNKLPLNIREPTIEKHKAALIEEGAKMVADGVPEHLAQIRKYREANLRLLNYCEAYAKVMSTD